MSTVIGEATDSPTISSDVDARRAALELVGVSEQSCDGQSSLSLPGGRLLVRDVRGGIVVIPLSQVYRLEAQDDYVGVVTAGRSYLMSARLGELAAQLPADTFIRVHRSHVVNLDFVERFLPYDAKRLEVHLRNGTRIVASRAASEVIRRWAR